MEPPNLSHQVPPEVDCASRLRVLADRTRLEVMRLLIAGALHVGELNESLGIDQSLLSHHLRVLREAGLVVGERDGKAVLYRLAPGVRVKARCYSPGLLLPFLRCLSSVRLSARRGALPW